MAAEGTVGAPTCFGSDHHNEIGIRIDNYTHFYNFTILPIFTYFAIKKIQVFQIIYAFEYF
jgi:hypothetical protein